LRIRSRVSGESSAKLDWSNRNRAARSAAQRFVSGEATHIYEGYIRTPKGCNRHFPDLPTGRASQKDFISNGNSILKRCGISSKKRTSQPASKRLSRSPNFRN
jgi:hypothetical protein